ncbi:hypothetical protein [Acholeplasma palmae]
MHYYNDERITVKLKKRTDSYDMIPLK